MVDTSKYALGRFRTRGDDAALAPLTGEDEWYMQVAKQRRATLAAAVGKKKGVVEPVGRNAPND